MLARSYTGESGPMTFVQEGLKIPSKDMDFVACFFPFIFLKITRSFSEGPVLKLLLLLSGTYLHE